jgi:hypothetical protein
MHRLRSATAFLSVDINVSMATWKGIMTTFGDYKERCNAPNEPIVYRCGICFKVFKIKKELNRHHNIVGEKKYVYHEPMGIAGGLCYLVDAQGYRVNEMGRRY